jgi:hypothetical protein
MHTHTHTHTLKLINKLQVFLLPFAGESENLLIYDLFDRNGYNPLIRPVVNANDTLNISFNLALSQIINVVGLCVSLHLQSFLKNKLKIYFINCVHQCKSGGEKNRAVLVKDMTRVGLNLAIDKKV